MILSDHLGNLKEGFNFFLKDLILFVRSLFLRLFSGLLILFDRLLGVTLLLGTTVDLPIITLIVRCLDKRSDSLEDFSEEFVMKEDLHLLLRIGMADKLKF
jgi:hypothetical protein